MDLVNLELILDPSLKIEEKLWVKTNGIRCNRTQELTSKHRWAYALKFQQTNMK